MADVHGILDGLFISELRILGYPQPAIDRELHYRRLARNMPSTNIRIPEYKMKLMDKGLIFTDGKKVNGKLINVARYLEKECGIETTEKFLQEEFLKPNGSQYSFSYCKKIIAQVHDWSQGPDK